MYLCFDIGGTRIKGGVLDETGEICLRKEVETDVSSGPAGILKQLKYIEEELLREHPYWQREIKGVGVGVPGFIENGWVWEAVNLGWKNIPLLQELRSVFSYPIFILNDANAAALGEMWLGAGRGLKHILCVTVGTGIGAGVIVNGEIQQGKYGMAGEIGHFKCIEEGALCTCGNQGCLETLTSATAIAHQGIVEEAKGMSMVLTRMLREKGKIRSWDIIKEARKGEPVCVKIVEEAGKILGRALGNIFLVFAPERILIGGGVAKAGPLFLNGIRDGFKETVPGRMKHETIIFLARLGNDAGMVGLGKYIQMNLDNKGENYA